MDGIKYLRWISRRLLAEIENDELDSGAADYGSKNNYW